MVTTGSRINTSRSLRCENSCASRRESEAPSRRRGWRYSLRGRQGGHGAACLGARWPHAVGRHPISMKSNLDEGGSGGLGVWQLCAVNCTWWFHSLTVCRASFDRLSGCSTRVFLASDKWVLSRVRTFAGTGIAPRDDGLEAQLRRMRQLTKARPTTLPMSWRKAQGGCARPASKGIHDAKQKWVLVK